MFSHIFCRKNAGRITLFDCFFLSVSVYCKCVVGQRQNKRSKSGIVSGDCSSLMRNLKVILYQIQENNGFRDDSCLLQSQLTQRWVTEIKIISKKNCEVNEDCTMSRCYVYATLPVLPIINVLSSSSLLAFEPPACYSLPPAGRVSMTKPTKPLTSLSLMMFATYFQNKL